MIAVNATLKILRFHLCLYATKPSMLRDIGPERQIWWGECPRFYGECFYSVISLSLTLVVLVPRIFVSHAVIFVTMETVDATSRLGVDDDNSITGIYWYIEENSFSLLIHISLLEVFEHFSSRVSVPSLLPKYPTNVRIWSGTEGQHLSYQVL